jgi:hypothetical protein
MLRSSALVPLTPRHANQLGFTIESHTMAHKRGAADTLIS